MEVLKLDMDNCPYDKQPADCIVCEDCSHCADLNSKQVKCTYNEDKENEI